jgi:hypothetical protein
MPSLRSDSVILQQLVHSNAPAMATILENSGFEWNMLAPQWFLQVRMRAHLDAELPQNHYPHTTIKFPYKSNRDTAEKCGLVLQHIFSSQNPFFIICKHLVSCLLVDTYIW